ncbi:hypothetical protein ABBQ38_009274 [Trebouxia sp. C0009 RCD-2024]
MKPSVLSGLLQRQSEQSQRTFTKQLEADRVRSLAFDTSKQISSIHKGGVTWLHLERSENRYLLAGSADCSVAVYDVAQPTQGDKADTGRGDCGSVLKITSSNPDCHRYSVSSVAWYPVDTGLFVTGSFDHQVKVWDANLGQAACSFTFPDRVFGVAMSSAAATHCLIAVVGGDPHVKLCDPATGGFTHSLVGHREPVWAVSWSLDCEYHLVTGGCDGQVRMWDVRTYNCLQVFDEQITQKPKAKPSRPDSASNRKRAKAEQAKKAEATAHDGRVTGILPTPDGLHWLTAGTDNRLRLWDAQHNYHLLVNYPQTFNSSMKARQLAVAGEEDVIFHPSGGIIQCLHRLTGQKLGTLRGHLDTVNCCCYNSYQQELYSGGNDCNIIVWAAPAPLEVVEGLDTDDQDAWSD